MSKRAASNIRITVLKHPRYDEVVALLKSEEEAGRSPAFLACELMKAGLDARAEPNTPAMADNTKPTTTELDVSGGTGKRPDAAPPVPSPKDNEAIRQALSELTSLD
jgi:hypothetical protein